jgi:hypothetical protein
MSFGNIVSLPRRAHNAAASCELLEPCLHSSHLVVRVVRVTILLQLLVLGYLTRALDGRHRLLHRSFFRGTLFVPLVLGCIAFCHPRPIATFVPIPFSVAGDSP